MNNVVYLPSMDVGSSVLLGQPSNFPLSLACFGVPLPFDLGFVCFSDKNDVLNCITHEEHQSLCGQRYFMSDQ